MAQSLTTRDEASLEELRPLLIQQSEDSVDNNSEEEEEQAWLEHLQRLPWYRRPSATWMMVVTSVLGIAITAVASSREQLAIQVICKDFLSKDPLNTIDLTSHIPKEVCNQPEVLAAVAVLEGRLTAIRGIL
ncbi:hypothetical protein BGZ94_009203, partial [Podila epigama]